MLRVSQLLIAGLAAIVAPGLQAECAYPKDVVIPDGAASTYEEMRDSGMFIKEYIAEMETYLECLEQEDSARANAPAGEDELSGEDEQLRTRRRHAAIDAMESVTARFNEQVGTFKKVNP